MTEINPFNDLIVTEPRNEEPSVQGLNEAPLKALLAEFGRLTEGNLPRAPKAPSRAQLVTSGQPGFGKSHLIGRLFKSLHGQATLVYVRPFQNSALAFQSVLATVIKELNFADRLGAEDGCPAEPTQLDRLAFGVFAHLLADHVERQGNADPETARWLRKDPVSAFAEGLPTETWGRWMHETFATNLPAYTQGLVRRKIELHSPQWLRVLFAYAFNYPNLELRLACLDWIGGQPLSAEQGALIGLRPAELLDADAPPDLLNQTCRTRLVDLCQLAGFYRPVVFCFDQTESYGHSAALARSFGMVIATLVNEAPNQLTLVTSNQAPWLKTIATHFEDADRERIAHPPLTLEGLTRQQGEELIRLRLEDSGLQHMLKEMLDGSWLRGEFTTDRDQRGTRRFLQLCKERWETLRHRPPPPVVSLEQLYEERRLKLLADPKRLLFDADALRWLVTDCAKGLPGLEVFGGGSGFFTVGWKSAQRNVLFGFEAGSNWKRWVAIARHAHDRTAKTPSLKAVLFRDVSQPQIPGPAWVSAGELNAAKLEYLHLIVLSRDDLSALYAGFDLYLEALGGNIEPHGANDVLVFLRSIFAPWWERLAGPVEGSAPPAEPSVEAEERFAERVRTIVSEEKFLSVDEVIARLGGNLTQDDVLKACRYHTTIRIHVHPNMTVLQWQNL